MPVLQKALSGADRLQPHGVTLALGLLWDFRVWGRHAPYLLSLSFCSNTSMRQLETPRLVGFFEALNA